MEPLINMGLLALGDGLSMPLGSWLNAHYIVAPWFEMLLWASLFMLVVLAFVRIAGFPERCRQARRHMVAAAYELWLNRYLPWQIAKSELRLVQANVRLLVWLLPSIAFSAGIFILAFAHLDARFGYAPIQPGRDFVVQIEPAHGDGAAALPDLLLRNAQVTSPLVRVRPNGANREWFRLAPDRLGQLKLDLGEACVIANIGQPAFPCQSDQRVGRWLVRIGYPHSRWFGHEYGWMATFFAMCLVVALPLAKVVRVRL